MNDSDSEASDAESRHLTPSESTFKPRRLWTKQEDEKLRLLVSYWGDQGGRRSNWDKIAANFENRTPKNCRKRWFHSLDPKLRRGKWSKAEDKVLKEAYEQMGASWQRIAQLIPGRTDDQCAKRYNDVLNPAIVDRLRPWSAEEDAKLRQLRQELGPKWQQISTHLPGRTGLTIRNRYRKLTRTVRASSDASVDIAGDLGAGPSKPNYSATAEPQRPLETLLPFDVPGSNVGAASFPAGSDPSWLHLHANAPPQTPTNLLANLPAHAHSHSHLALPAHLQLGYPYAYQTTAFLPPPPVMESTESSQTSAQFGTPVYAQLQQNAPISGTRRQFSVTLGSQDTTPLTFLRDEHQSITSQQLEQIMEFAAKHRQQIVVHQHIYQVVGEPRGLEAPASVSSTTTVVRPRTNEGESDHSDLPINTHSNLPINSEIPNTQINPPNTQINQPNAQINSQVNQQIDPQINSQINQQINTPNTQINPHPNQQINPHPNPQINPHPNPQITTPNTHTNLVDLGPLNYPNLNRLDLPIETFRALSPPSQLQSPKEFRPPRPYIRQNSVPEPATPAPRLTEPTPDEFLNRPLLFEEMGDSTRFDPDDLDFLAFNPS